MKSFAPVTTCITNIDGTTIDDVENLVIIMYNFLEKIWNYSDPTGSLWVYSKGKTANFNSDIVNTENVKSFMYKTKLIRSTVVNGILNNHCEIVWNTID